MKKFILTPLALMALVFSAPHADAATGDGALVPAPDYQQTMTLFESGGEQLRIALAWSFNLIGTRQEEILGAEYVWGARGCFSRQNISSQKVKPDGSFEFKETMSMGTCEVKNCNIVLSPGWAEYQRVCDGKVFATGRFDRVTEAEAFEQYIDRNAFFQDPNAENIAASIPARPPRLEDNDPTYKALANGVSNEIREAASTGAEIELPDSALRDLVDAILAIDTKGWRFHTYIPGSIRDVQVTNSNALRVVRANLTYLDPQVGAWREGWTEMELRNGAVQCIRFWDNQTCSENYPLLVNLDENRELSSADASCLSVETASYEEYVPESCAVWNSRTSQCELDSPGYTKSTDYRQIVNSCSRPITAVLDCQLARQGVTFAANSAFPAPGFSVLNCKIEKSLRPDSQR